MHVYIISYFSVPFAIILCVLLNIYLTTEQDDTA